MVFARLLLLLSLLAGGSSAVAAPATWTADNGNGTYTNPVFYDEFSDPDLIRVGDWFYMTGTTMHAVPGLPLLRSHDLVNWEFVSYALTEFPPGPEYRLEEGKDLYGQGIWAPVLRHHDGRFHIFANINERGLHVFTAEDPAGPWTHKVIDRNLHDLSVLFDDDGRVWAVFNYNEVRLVELEPDLSGVVEGSERVIIPAGNGMGEGHHFYKVAGRYYIISANYAPVGRMQAARADSLDGPWETVAISASESMGFQRGWWEDSVGQRSPIPADGARFSSHKPGDNELGAVPLHQGGIVQAPDGSWWGFSMMDLKSIGRTTFLSPVTWHEGWPYFGLPGNLGRSPRTWTKPKVDVDVKPHAPYRRSDDFSAAQLQPVWQWNHQPADGKWSLQERRGHLRLHAMPAEGFLHARNTLTQRVVGPEATATVVLDAGGLQPGDIAGLGVLNMPAAWLAVVQEDGRRVLRWYSQAEDRRIDVPLPQAQVHLRLRGDHDEDLAWFSWSVDGREFQDIGTPVRLPYQLKTFQGSRYALFAFNSDGREGGHADFDRFELVEPLADRSRNIPLGQVVTLENLGDGSVATVHPLGVLQPLPADAEKAKSPLARFRVHDRGGGQVALEAMEAMDGSGFLTVDGIGLSADVRLLPEHPVASRFMWQDLLRGQFMLLSMKTHRYLGILPGSGEPYAADRPGTRPDRRDGTVLVWRAVEAP
ncbi:glycoside hydrolase family 43 protein [Pseudoxanthomonas suwonensis]|uniref:glycoside hydrolase family 43 protein n=1 Tax=Pseudoxanthomonas suwonensis TaxID=314722 RepID=UPI000467081B|nr:glycoside hydrolase 43 family protein [Pseudoxanthomonas suwonensis]